MIPAVNTALNQTMTLAETPTRTFALNAGNNTIGGFVDGAEAMLQAIYLIVNTERFKHEIYSWNYGVELIDLMGGATSYVTSEIKRRITEALLQDRRIRSVDGFDFKINGANIEVSFSAKTVFGTISVERELSL